MALNRKGQKIYFSSRNGLHCVDQLKGQQWEAEDNFVLKLEHLLPRGSISHDSDSIDDDTLDKQLRKRYRFLEDHNEDFWSLRDETFRGNIHTVLPGKKIERSFSKIIAIEHLGCSNELCCASGDGSVWSYKLNTGTVKRVATFQHGIEAMQWCSNQRIVVFVDKKLNVITMTARNYKQINKVNLNEVKFPAGECGETSSPHSTSEEAAKDKSKDNDFESYEEEPFVCISWSRKGNFFAVSFKARCGLRAFAVFNKSGAFKHMSGLYQGLYSSLAWQQSQEKWIAMPQTNAGKRFVIALFKRNGVRSKEIATPLCQEKHEIKSLHWSPDSEVLAVHWYSLDEDAQNHIFLYAKDNDHWYLKYSLVWTENIYGVQWGLSGGNTLHLLTGSLRYERIRLDFRVDRSMGHGEDDKAMVAIINGNRIHLTSFCDSILPSLDSNYILTLEEGVYANDVGFIRTPGRWDCLNVALSSNAFFVVDSTNRITFYDVTFEEQCKNGGSKRTALKEVKMLLSQAPLRSIDPSESFDSLIHWLWVNPDHVVLCCNNYFVTLNLEDPKQTTQCYEWIEHEANKPFKEHETIGCVEALGSEKVLIELTSGRLMEVARFTLGKPGVTSFTITPHLHSWLPKFCEQLFIDRSCAKVYGHCRSGQSLFHGKTMLATQVVSAFLTRHHLIYNIPRALHLVPHVDCPEITIVDETDIRPKSEIVMVVPETATVFLRRGELEIVKSRFLLLHAVGKYVDKLEYYEACAIMHKEQINLNLLVDHDAGRFLEHLESHFLPQMRNNVSWLNLFVSSVTNEDVCETMYATNYPGRQNSAGALANAGSSEYRMEGKVQYICERLLNAMGSDPAVLTQPKLGCYVKQGELERALALIWELKNKYNSSKAGEKALSYLVGMTGVDVVNDAALGTYDLALAEFVATKLQKVSKSYLSFLGELKGLDEHCRKYRIDCHVKRYDRAVAYVSRSDVTDSCLQEVLMLIFAHKLYPIGIEYFQKGNHKKYLPKIYERYAEHLSKTGLHAEASLIYERAGDIPQAISSACQALDWNRVLDLNARSKDPQSVESVLRPLVSELIKAGEHIAAAPILHEHLNDTQRAVDYLLNGHCYDQVRSMLACSGQAKQQQNELIRNRVHQHLNSFITKITSDRDHYLKQKELLLYLRASYAVARRAVEVTCRNIVPVTRSTNTGRRGNKNRKLVRQVFKVAKGNPFQHLTTIDALIGELHSFVLRVCGVEWQRNVRNILELAMELRFDNEARIIQQDYGELMQLICSSLDTIWTPEMVLKKGSQPVWSGEQVGVRNSQLAPFYQSPANLRQALDQQQYSLLQPYQLFKPDIQSCVWQLDILN